MCKLTLMMTHVILVALCITELMPRYLNYQLIVKTICILNFYLQIKVFCDLGAERKARNEERRANKRKMNNTGAF